MVLRSLLGQIHLKRNTLKSESLTTWRTLQSMRGRQLNHCPKVKARTMVRIQFSGWYGQREFEP